MFKYILSLSVFVLAMASVPVFGATPETGGACYGPKPVRVPAQ